MTAERAGGCGLDDPVQLVDRSNPPADAVERRDRGDERDRSKVWRGVVVLHGPRRCLDSDEHGPSKDAVAASADEWPTAERRRGCDRRSAGLSYGREHGVSLHRVRRDLNPQQPPHEGEVTLGVTPSSVTPLRYGSPIPTFDRSGLSPRPPDTAPYSGVRNKCCGISRNIVPACAGAVSTMVVEDLSELLHSLTAVERRRAALIANGLR